MTFYTEVVESMPIGVEMTTPEIALNWGDSRGKKIESWERKTIITRVNSVMRKGVDNGRITDLGMSIQGDNNTRVRSWMRLI